MLATIHQISPRLFWRQRLSLLAVATLTLALPTMRATPVAAEDEQAKAATETPVTTTTITTTTTTVTGKTSVTETREKTPQGEKQAGGKPQSGVPYPTYRWYMANGTIMAETKDPIGPPGDEEIPNFIRDKRYTLLSTFDSDNGVKQYVYRFPNGKGRNFPVSLDDVSSWDELVKKAEKQRQLRHDRINQAIVAGHYRLLNVEFMLCHVCRDVKSGRQFKVQRVQTKDGAEIAAPRADFGKIPPGIVQTSWAEHLQAIRDGKRDLLESAGCNNYTYEMIADDGTKVIFNFGGTQPLKPIEKK